MQKTILHIDSAFEKCSVAISSKDRVLTQCDSDENNIHDRILTTLVQQCFCEANLNFDSLIAISLNMGPGSFTGLRIGMSTAKGICFGLNIPMIGLDSLEILSHSVKVKKNKIVIIPNIRSTYYYFEGQNSLSECYPEKVVADKLKGFDLEKYLLIMEKGKKYILEELGLSPSIKPYEVVREASLQHNMAWGKFAKKEFLHKYISKPRYIVDFVPTKPKKFF